MIHPFSQPRSFTNQISLTCPSCRTSLLNIPEDILEIEEDSHLEPPKSRRWSRRPNWISRPINRKNSVTSSLPGSKMPPSLHGMESDRTSRHNRRASVSSDASDSSSQTKVETPPPPRSILQHSPSVSSNKSSRSGKSTLATKRSVKFSEEPVYYDYSYRFSTLAATATCTCACKLPPEHSPFCKIPFDCAGECLLEDFQFYRYDDDMFSFEQPATIPSERRWGIFSRFIAWLRRRTGQRTYTIEAEKRRPKISRPLPLTPRQLPVAATRVIRERERRRRLRRRTTTPYEGVWG